MRILVVSLFLPRARACHAGGRYVWHVVRELAARGHDVDIATRFEEGEEGEVADLQTICRRIYPFPYPALPKRNIGNTIRLLLNYLRFGVFADRVLRRGRYDVVQVEYTEAALLLSRRHAPLVLDAHDVVTKPAERRWRQARGPRKLAAWLVWRATRLVETGCVRSCARTVTLSGYDHEYLQRLEPRARVETLPIPAGLDFTGRSFERSRRDILFLASFRHRRVNVEGALWFYREVFPLVRERVPDARFVIAGYGPPEELTRAVEGDPAVTVAGYVEDIERCHKEAAVFAVPLHTGGGIIVKLLDALAAGTPVASTTIGNEGVAAVPGRDLLVADTPEEFAAAVVHLLLHREEALQMGERGRRFVAGEYPAEITGRRLEQIYREVIGEKSE